MAYTDPLTTLKTIIDTITIAPEIGNPAISKNVKIGWLDVSGKNTNGEITPTYTILKSTAPYMPFDGNDSVSEITMTIQVDVWNTPLGVENAALLHEKMLEQLRTVIRTNRSNPSGTIRHLTLLSEADKTEVDTKPIIRRTMVLIGAKCFR